MSLSDKIRSDMKDAMRARDKARLEIVRMILAAIKQREVDERITLDDGQVLAVLEKMVKQRHESAALYEKGARPELAAKELAEIADHQSLSAREALGRRSRRSDRQGDRRNRCRGPTGHGQGHGPPQAGGEGRIDMGRASAAVKKRLAG